ncbi:MAG: hypothetical protein PHH02_05150 [Dehalococcoidales bacterium]|nr:hypothetical protein [Dehalococcoidales bacterium]
MQIVNGLKKSNYFRFALAIFLLVCLNSTITACKTTPDDVNLGSPFPPEWNPQKQALLPDKEFDANWAETEGWYRALNRGLSALWLSWDPGPSFISSPADENSSTMLGLSEGLPPGSGQSLLRCIFAKDLPGGIELDLLIKLYDGASLIGEWIEENVSDIWTTREFELKTEPSGWADLRVELIRQGDTSVDEADLRRVNISVVEVEIPYPDTFTFPYLNPATTTHSPGSDTVKSPPGLQEGEVILVCSFDGEAAEGFEPLHSQPSVEDASRPYEMRTWFKRAGLNEPEEYTFPGADGLWAARLSGVGPLVVVSGHTEPPPDGFVSPLGIMTPSVDAPTENCLVVRISANSGYITWTEPHQWMAWNEWPCCAASWSFQRESGPTGEEYHGTGSFIHWVAQTMVFTPE